MNKRQLGIGYIVITGQDLAKDFNFYYESTLERQEVNWTLTKELVRSNKYRMGLLNFKVLGSPLLYIIYGK